MRTTKVSLGVAVAAVVVTVLVAFGSQSVFAQADPFIGTWVLNLAKSKYQPGPAPKTQTSIYEASGQGVKVTTIVGMFDLVQRFSIVAAAFSLLWFSPRIATSIGWPSA